MYAWGMIQVMDVIDSMKLDAYDLDTEDGAADFLEDLELQGCQVDSTWEVNYARLSRTSQAGVRT